MPKTLEEFLFDNNVYDAWQFVANTAKTIHTAESCKNIVVALKDKMADCHDKWLASLATRFSEDVEEGGKIHKITINGSDIPSHNTEIAGVELDTAFLMDMLTKDFFQYARNAFDSMSQIVNAACLATNAKKLEKIDFGIMKSIISQATYSAAFPDMQAWYDTIADSDEFKYIDAFCNRTKHTCDVYQKVTLAILGGENTATINPFYRKSEQHEKKDVGTYLEAVYSFVEVAFEQFIDVLKTEVAKCLFVEHRYHKLKVYQQKLKDSPEKGFSVVYIDGTVPFSAMPENIQVLLLNKDADGDISSKDCPVETIYVNNVSKKHEFIGRYEAVDDRGIDTLIRYRTYKKIESMPNEAPLFLQAMIAPENQKSFYHANPYMDITTISDDDTFLARVNLPF